MSPLIDSKQLLNKKIADKNENELRPMMTKSKCDDLKGEKFGLKPYFKNLSVTNSRTKFRFKTKMTQVKFNFRNDSNNARDSWICDSCESSAIESQSHIIWCEAYSHLREGLNVNCDKDLTKYIGDVMKIREELQLRR